MTTTNDEVDLVDQLPDAVNILHRRFALVERDMQAFATDRRFGEINFVNSSIEFLDREGSDTAETILHEIIHGLWNLFDLDSLPAKEEDVEEHVVRTLATGLITVMKDNPTLFPTLQQIVDG